MQMSVSQHTNMYAPSTDALDRHDYGVSKKRKMASTGGGRAWSEDEEIYLLQTRLQKMPYKHIAAHLKKTELACRLHYHQLSHGSNRRKRTSSASSGSSTPGRSPLLTAPVPSPMGEHEHAGRGHAHGSRSESPPGSSASYGASPGVQLRPLLSLDGGASPRLPPILPKPVSMTLALANATASPNLAAAGRGGGGVGPSSFDDPLAHTHTHGLGLALRPSGQSPRAASRSLSHHGHGHGHGHGQHGQHGHTHAHTHAHPHPHPHAHAHGHAHSHTHSHAHPQRLMPDPLRLDCSALPPPSGPSSLCPMSATPSNGPWAAAPTQNPNHMAPPHPHPHSYPNPNPNPHSHPHSHGPPVDMARLNAVYSAHRAPFWSAVAADYGPGANPLVLEQAWRDGVVASTAAAGHHQPVVAHAPMTPVGSPEDHAYATTTSSASTSASSSRPAPPSDRTRISALLGMDASPGLGGMLGTRDRDMARMDDERCSFAMVGA